MTADVKADSRVRCSTWHQRSCSIDPRKRRGQQPRRLIMLIFVGWVPPYLYPSGCLPRSRREDLSQPHNAHEGCTHHRGCVSSEDRCRSLSRLLRGRGLRSGNRPHEGCEFARDGGGNGVRVLAARAQLAISPTEADLRPPGDVANRCREMLLARLDLLGDLGAVTIGLRGFDQNAARMAVARLRDAAEPAPVAARVLTRREPEIAHELARIIEAGEVAEFGDRGIRDRELHVVKL